MTMAVLTDKDKLNSHIQQNGAVKMTLMHRGKLQKRSDFSYFRCRRLAARPLPRPSPAP